MPDLHWPPLPGLDERAGDVENGVIGAGHRKLRRAVYGGGLVVAGFAAACIVLAMAMIFWGQA